MSRKGLTALLVLAVLDKYCGAKEIMGCTGRKLTVVPVHLISTVICQTSTSTVMVP